MLIPLVVALLFLFFSSINSQSCGQLDLILVLDGSSAVGAANFKSEINVALSVVSKIGLSDNEVNVMGVIYGNTTETEVFLPFTSDLSTAVIALSDLSFLGDASAPGTGLYFAANETSNRAGAANAVLFFSGSTGNEGLDTINVASSLKQNHQFIFGVGAGGNCDVTTLQTIVSSSSYYFYFQEFSDAINSVPKILTSLCSIVPSSSSSSTISSSSSSASSSSPYTNTGGSTYCGGIFGHSSNCAQGSQCCSDSIHPGSPYYCCLGEGSCCFGECCAPGLYCTGRQGNCTEGPGHTSSDPYTTTSGSSSCGHNNWCAPGGHCCSDNSHPGNSHYCCRGSDTCCGGVCCGSDGKCATGTTCTGTINDHFNSFW